MTSDKNNVADVVATLKASKTESSDEIIDNLILLGFNCLFNNSENTQGNNEHLEDEQIISKKNTITVEVSFDVYHEYTIYLSEKYTDEQLMDEKIWQVAMDEPFLNIINSRKKATTSAKLLLFDKKPIKKRNVLQNLDIIVISLQKLPRYPILKPSFIDRTVQDELSELDPRTIKKYIECVKSYSRPLTNGVGNIVGYDVERFVLLMCAGRRLEE